MIRPDPSGVMLTLFVSARGLYTILSADGSVRELPGWMTAREAWEEYSREWEKHL